MSEVVEGLDLSEVPTRGRPPKYRWAEWFDGQTHRLVLGEDYDADSIKSFRSTVYSAAKRLDIQIVTRVIKGDLHVQAILPKSAPSGHTKETEGGNHANKSPRRRVRSRS